MPKSPQTALYISNPGRYKEFIAGIKNFDRIYSGSEFCENKIVHDTKIFEKLAELNSFSLVLPAVITRDYFKKIEKLILSIASIQKNFELVVNDFGMLEWYSQKARKFPLVIGRILCQFNFLTEIKNKGDCKILDIEKCRFSSKEFKVSRYEISCLPQPHRYILPKGLNISLYYPYTFITMTRNCSFRPSEASLDTVCHHECGNNQLELTHPSTEDQLLMINNGYMLDCKPGDLKSVLAPHINRYVWQQL